MCDNCPYITQGGYCHNGQEASCPNIVEVDERRCTECGEWVPPYKVETYNATAYPENGYKLVNGQPVCRACRRANQQRGEVWN